MLIVKDVQYSDSARTSLKTGVDKMANAVKITLGPQGRNVVIERPFGGPHVTKDGVTVAKSIDIENPVEQLGAQMVLQAATRTAEKAGDGTTTATLLAQAIVSEGHRLITTGVNPMELRKGIDCAVKLVVQGLEQLRVPISYDAYEAIEHVATISANNNPEIGRLVADAMAKVGKLGTVTIDESKTNETYIDIVEGMQFDRGYISPYFITSPKMEADYTDVLILVYDRTISNLQPLMPLLERANSTGLPLLIIAADVDSEALQALVVNKLKGVLKVVAVKAPGFGDRRKDMLEDIAVLTGGTFVSADLNRNLNSVTISELGRANRVIVGKDYTIISGGRSKQGDLNERIEMIKTQLVSVTSDYDREKLQERLAKLSGGIGAIKVGASSEIELKEKKDLVEDALHATRAALEEGIVPGGGVAYLRAIDFLVKEDFPNSSYKDGFLLVKKVLLEPFLQILRNCGLEERTILNNVMKGQGDYGFNSATEKYANLFIDGVIDPKKVVRIALENAASVASTILTTEATITDIRDEMWQKLNMPAMER